MSQREVNITELHAAGTAGRKLLALAQFAKVSFQTEEQDGHHEAWVGGPYEFTIHPRKGEDIKPRGSGEDLNGALKDLFNQITRGYHLLKSEPPAGERGVKSYFRYRDGKFQV